MPGLSTRLENEIRSVVADEPTAPSSSGRAVTASNVRVMPPTEAPCDATTWHGATVLAGTSTFAENWCVHAPASHPPAGYGGDDEAYDDDDDDDDDASESENEYLCSDDGKDDNGGDDDDDSNDDVQAPDGRVEGEEADVASEEANA